MLSKREELISTAKELFSEHGFHATGIDRILAKSGIAKKTLYNHFRTKEELILAVLKQHDSEFRNFFRQEVEACSPDPRERLLAIFDVAETWFSLSSFFGCLFINAIGEYSEQETAIRDVCREFKQLLRSYIESIAIAAGASDPKALATELALLLEGAIVTAQVSAHPHAAQTAKQIATTLIDAATETTA